MLKNIIKRGIATIPLIALPLALNNCEENKLEDPLIVKIYQGNHYYENSGELIITKDGILDYLVTFPETQLHPTLPEGCEGDWNKVIGMARNQSEHHHINSARFVYKCMDSTLQIGWYNYINSVRTSGFISNIQTNTPYNLKLIDRDNKYWDYYFEGDLVKTVEHPTSDNTRRVLHPYFGGDCTFPNQESYIKFDRLQ